MSRGSRRMSVSQKRSTVQPAWRSSRRLRRSRATLRRIFSTQ
ncbi:MAG TPA: hypothetical protein VFA20_29330 [Myxococcaceae bacterium]|nr:hypothetical protein [Myxococcaceae bacterium]